MPTVSNIIREFVEAILLALVVFVVIQTSVQNFKVEGSSMRPTLEGGQYLLVNKLVYLKIDQERFSRILPFWGVSDAHDSFAVHPPERGEVIVFHFPNNTRRDFVKRVIGIPGDTVEFAQGKVIVNGEALVEPYNTRCDNSEFCQMTLGEKEYYVLGDNRGGSNDSRSWGIVPEANILGKVWIIYWPVSNWTLLK